MHFSHSNDPVFGWSIGIDDQQTSLLRSKAIPVGHTALLLTGCNTPGWIHRQNMVKYSYSFRKGGPYYIRRIWSLSLLWRHIHKRHPCTFHKPNWNVNVPRWPALWIHKRCILRRQVRCQLVLCILWRANRQSSRAWCRVDWHVGCCGHPTGIVPGSACHMDWDVGGCGGPTGKAPGRGCRVDWHVGQQA